MEGVPMRKRATRANLVGLTWRGWLSLESIFPIFFDMSTRLGSRPILM
jgi:hypothetical protein